MSFSDKTVPRKIRTIPYYDAAAAGLCLTFLGSIISGIAEYGSYLFYAILVAILYNLYSQILRPQLFTKPLAFKIPAYPGPKENLKFRQSKKYATQVINNIFWKTVILNRSAISKSEDRRNAVVAHEYGHVFYKDSKYFQFLTTLFLTVFFIILIWGFIFWFFGLITLLAFISLLWEPNNIEVIEIITADGEVFTHISAFLGHICIFAVSALVYMKSVHDREYNADNFSKHYFPDGIRRYLHSLHQRKSIKKIKSSFIDSFLNFVLIWQTFSHANIWARITHPSPKKRLEMLDKESITFNPVSTSIYASLTLNALFFTSSAILMNIQDLNFWKLSDMTALTQFIGFLSLLIAVFLGYSLHSFHCYQMVSHSRPISDYIKYLFVFIVVFWLSSYTYISVFKGEPVFLNWDMSIFFSTWKKPLCVAVSLLPIFAFFFFIKLLKWRDIRHPVFHSLIGFTSAQISIYF